MSPVLPRLAVSAGVWRAGRVLLIRRGQAPLSGLWTFPGGHVEPGEAVADAVRREVMEETGLAVEIAGEPLVHEIVRRDSAGVVLGHHVLLVHAARALDHGAPVAASDAADARYFAPDEIAGLDTTPRLDHFVAETGVRAGEWPR